MSAKPEECGAAVQRIAEEIVSIGEVMELSPERVLERVTAIVTALTKKGSKRT